MTTLLPVDEDSHPIPAMRLKGGSAHVISASAASARNTTAFDVSTKVISLFATGAVYIRFGGADVTASTSDHYFPEGLYYDFAISGGESGKGPQHSHIAVVAAGEACTLHISEKE